jgi:hypothetical protein
MRPWGGTLEEAHTIYSIVWNSGSIYPIYISSSQLYDPVDHVSRAQQHYSSTRSHKHP